MSAGGRLAGRRFAGRRAAAVAVGLLALTGVLSGCTSTAPGDPNGKNGVYTDSTGLIQIKDASVRKDPVTLTGKTLEGNDFNITSLRGKIVVLNTWYSSCGPCRKEAADLVEAYDVLSPQGVEFLGLNTKQGDDAEAKTFQRVFKIPYPSLADNGGKTLLGLRGDVSPNAIPSTVVLDEQGRIAARISGQTTKNTILGVVDSVKTGRVSVWPSASAGSS